jgi:HD superfamily phosphohydrolase
MKTSGLIVLAGLTVIGLAAARAADATSPVDYTQRNTPYNPGATVVPDKKTPEKNEVLQDKRFDKTTVDKKPAAVGDRKAPVDVKEARDKAVKEKDSHRPEKIEQPMSRFDHREATISTADESTRKPETVSKYQESLTSASATNMARFPALDRATTAKINRFVFRKNAPDAATVLKGVPVTPAAGAAGVQKK